MAEATEPGKRRPRRDPQLRAGEPPLIAFISSAMDEEMKQPRDDAVAALDAPTFLVPWAFEYTPASSERADWLYLSKVREADVVVWLVGSRTTEPVQREVREALAHRVPLIIIRLEGVEPDATTQLLIDEVGLSAKWIRVAGDQVRDAVALTMGDEIVRAWRSKPGRTRAAALELQGRLSRARCIQRWRAAGLTRAEALILADDLDIGRPPEEVRPTTDQPLRVIESEVGSGKSLCGERLFQEAISRALGDPDAPIPVWLTAREAQSDLMRAIQDAAGDVGEPSRHGASVVIDGADEVGASVAGSLLNAARIVVETWPRMRIVITTRPLAPLERLEESVRLPLLEEQDSLALVERVSGSRATGYGWPASVTDAVRRPLFAILLGVWLRDRAGTTPRSTGEMLRALVERAIPDGDAETSALLRRLAQASTDRGDGPVPLAEIADRDRLSSLRASGLVVERGGAVSFGLPILTQWFAAQSLAGGDPGIEELLSDPVRLDLWRYALIIATGELSFEQASALLDPIVRADPGFASQVVHEAFRDHADAGEGLTAPPALQAAEAIRRGTESWLVGVGPTARLLGIARPDGSPLPLGAVSFDGSLMTMWRIADDSETDVVELPPGEHILQASPGWGQGRLTRPPSEAGWPWRWSLNELVASLKPWIKERLLPLEDGPLFDEAAWAEALAILGIGSLAPEPIELGAIEERLDAIPRNAFVRDYRRTYDLRAIRARVVELRKAGETELRGPWPPPDRGIGSVGWVWEPYSPSRLLDRTQAVYAGALRGYAQLVERWLPNLAPRLMTYATLPAQLVGSLYFTKGDSDLSGSPVLSWQLEAVDPSLSTTVDIALSAGRRDQSTPDRGYDLRRAYEKLRAQRPSARHWISATSQETLLDVFGSTPATEIAFGLLSDDLKRTKFYS